MAVYAVGNRSLKHPFGVKPIGNYFDDQAKGLVECRVSGLGKLCQLSDEQMLNVLGYLSPYNLFIFGACSHAAYIFSSHDELWRTLLLEELGSSFVPKTTWKESYIATKRSPSIGEKRKRKGIITTQGFYSDLLFQSFYCTASSIAQSWLIIENMDRRSAKDLSVEEFQEKYEARNYPVIITDAMTNWSACNKWSDEYLIETCGKTTFYAGGFHFTMQQYLEYSRTLKDDQPLFIFDKHFASNVPQLVEDYHVPEYFKKDYFDSLEAPYRPDFRWLIIGPAKSGSSFHIDPNSTNAWNAVIRGEKKWIMFPPDVIPPGVHPSDDGGEVSTPVSLMEWFLTFYSECHKLPKNLQPLEGICREGEIVFVPNGWWHLVLNVKESIAITQNFVSTGNITNVMRFLQTKPTQVSGCSETVKSQLGKIFETMIETKYPDIHTKVKTALDLENAQKHKKSKWVQLLTNDTGENETLDTFSFSFFK